ncbi:MAG: TRAP transporter substrate-binding protein [Deltaproteobacteria bacterium]|nr:TRAP transporter substrate-binding protein [Deltaproteobacteria bacterium]
MIVKKTAVMVLIGVFIAAFFVFCNQPATAADKKPINLKFAYWMPTRHTLHGTHQKFAKEVELLTKGQVKITLYPGGALGKPKEQWDMAVGGIVDISFFIPSYTSGRFPFTSGLDLPLVVGGSAKVNTAIAWDIFERFLAPEYKAAKMLIFYGAEPFTIHTTKKQIRTLEDLKGLKIRSSGAMQSATVKQLGGIPVTMPISEAYTALEKGVVDGILTAFTAMKSFRLYDVCKYSIMMGLNSSPFAVAMNLKKWNSLPKDVQAVFDRLRVRYSFQSAIDYDYDRIKAIKFGKDKGKVIEPLPPKEFQKWMDRVTPLHDKWAADMKAKGLPGREMLNAISELKGK